MRTRFKILWTMIFFVFGVIMSIIFRNDEVWIVVIPFSYCVGMIFYFIGEYVGKSDERDYQEQKERFKLLQETRNKK